MNSNNLKRLIKIEDAAHRIAKEELGLNYIPAEIDIVPPIKMLEIMSYRGPTQISNWKFGRDFEKIRTFYEEAGRGLPYEVVIHSNPPRAYFMDNNIFGVQVLVMCHVIGHTHFSQNNKFFSPIRDNMIDFMALANERYNQYERKYGIDEVEKIVDAGHSIQWHSNPFDTETEQEKRLRIYNQRKRESHQVSKSEFADITGNEKSLVDADVALYNQRLWRSLQEVPVEPTEDLLRFIIDNSRHLEDWEKDILEILRQEGQYYWPIGKTKLKNEGFSCLCHQKIVKRLFEKGLLTAEEHGQYNLANSLVKARSDWSINPYLVGSVIWEDIENRWNYNKHGEEWENATISERANWNKPNNGTGWQKILNTIKSYSDWSFTMEFLTEDLIVENDLFIYSVGRYGNEIIVKKTKHTPKEIRELIVNSYAYSDVPKIEIVSGNNELKLRHSYFGIPLDRTYAVHTLKHISNLWGDKVMLELHDSIILVDRKKITINEI
jgi:stage V sporulation protein R